MRVQKDPQEQNIAHQQNEIQIFVKNLLPINLVVGIRFLQFSMINGLVKFVKNWVVKINLWAMKVFVQNIKV